MWTRACPHCHVKVPRSLILTEGDALVCPSCHAPLELSRSSRVLSAIIGLLAGFVVIHIVLQVSTTGRWVLPMVGAILAFALASAIVLLFLSDLVAQPRPPASHFPQSHK